MAQENNGHHIQVSTSKVVADVSELPEKAVRKGAVVMLTGNSQSRERVMLDRAGKLIPFDELSANRAAAEFESEVPGRETHVFIATNTVTGETFLPGEMPAHVPFVRLLIAEQPLSTFSGNEEDQDLTVPGDEGAGGKVIDYPSAPERSMVLADQHTPAIIAIRGTIVHTEVDPDTGEEDVDVFVQLFPSTDEVVNLFRVGVKVLASDEDRDADYDSRTILRARLESACRRLVNLYGKGEVQTGATFEIYCAHAYVPYTVMEDGEEVIRQRCVIVVQDIKLDGNPEGTFRDGRIEEDPLAMKDEEEQGALKRFFGGLGKMFKVKASDAQASESSTPNPWQTFGNDVVLLSQAEAILYGDLGPGLEEIWSRVIGHRPEVLKQLMARPVSTRPESKAQISPDKRGRIKTGRELLLPYDGPSLFSDLPTEGGD